MILLDPDLEPDPTPKPKPAKSPTLAAVSTRSLSRFLAQAQTALRLPGEVSVLLTTDRSIRRLNREFRGKDTATDVLSFPADPFMRRQQKIVGDLAISVGTAGKQGAAQGHSLNEEIKVLILHGLLHLAGYDHESDSGQMARRERRLRAHLGLPQGLIERSSPRQPTHAKARPTAGGRKL
jgi:probable rRNA maturation factor